MISHAARRRVLIVGADGLRPDLVNEQEMPNWTALTRKGTSFAEHHSVYPPHTRVNITALATGCDPGTHGIVNNLMYIPGAAENGLVDTGSDTDVMALERFTAGKAVLVPTLGDLLAAQDDRVAVASTGTSGASFLWTYRRPCRVIHPRTTYGQPELAAMREKLGDSPGFDSVHFRAQAEYVTEALRDILLPDEANRVIVLWLSEVDTTQHRYGLEAPQVKIAKRVIDDCLGAVLDALKAQGREDQFDILLMSDHGHSTVLHHRTLREQIQIAYREMPGLRPVLTAADDYLYGDATAAELAPLVEWIYAQPWAGAVFAVRPDLAALPGVFPLTALWNGRWNHRAPLLAISPAWSHARNEFGVPGTIAALTPHAALRSTHGSASPYDMHATLVAAGPDFREGVTSQVPTGVIDILPTVFALLGCKQPEQVQGRVLWEALRRPRGEAPAPQTEDLFPAAGAAGRWLRLHRVGPVSYLHGLMGLQSE